MINEFTVGMDRLKKEDLAKICDALENDGGLSVPVPERLDPRYKVEHCVALPAAHSCPLQHAPANVKYCSQSASLHFWHGRVPDLQGLTVSSPF